MAQILYGSTGSQKLLRAILVIALLVLFSTQSNAEDPSAEVDGTSMYWIEDIDNSDEDISDWPSDLNVDWSRKQIKRSIADITVVDKYENEADEDLNLELEISVDEDAGNVECLLNIYDKAGHDLLDRTAFVKLIKGTNSREFEWPNDLLPEGVYLARINVIVPPTNKIGFKEFFIRKISANTLKKMISDAMTKTSEIQKHLDNLDADISPYTRLKAIIAKDSAILLEGPLSEMSWRETRHIAQYVLRTTNSIHAKLSFGISPHELSNNVSSPDLSDIEIRDGAFYIDDQPAYLFGALVDQDALGKDLPMLKRYGFNFAKFEIDPEDYSISEKGNSDLNDALGTYYETADQDNIVLTCSLVPGKTVDSVTDEMKMEESGTSRINYGHPDTRKLIKQHYNEVVSNYIGREGFCPISLVYKPTFRFEGEDFRHGFIEYAKGLYSRRSEMNRIWKTRFSSMENIKIKRDHKRKAYQCDWQTYHNRLGTEFFSYMREVIHETAGEMPMMIEFENDLFITGASQNGIDYEALTKMFEITACSVSNKSSNRHYSLEYPGQCMTYTLLQSMAPDKPLINLEDNFITQDTHSTVKDYAFVHSLLWDGAIAGLNGSIVPGWDTENDLSILRRPECLEGYATACLDINRLGEIVQAFQKAPAEIGILWSPSSRMLDADGTYLNSVKNAFEGCSFAGGKVSFITERRCTEELLAGIKILVIPQTLAAPTETFNAIQKYIEDGGIVLRPGSLVMYDPHGRSQGDVLPIGEHNIFLPALDRPTEYLHAMDAAILLVGMDDFPGAVNNYDYPLEGVKVQRVVHDGDEYLYIVNVRKDKAICNLRGREISGRDLIRGRDVTFPRTLNPMDPMLVRVDKVIDKTEDLIIAESKDEPME